jgi:hypothetical protein
LQSRLEQDIVSAARPAPKQTIVPLAVPEPIPLADIGSITSRRKHLIVPDSQAKPGVPLDHMAWAGKYACIKRPDVIVHIGDAWDMPSLSSYDKGKRSFEGRRYMNDIKAGNAAMDLFMQPIYREVERSLSSDNPWQPELHFACGNHEFRIERATDDAAELHGLIGYQDLNLAQHGWKFHPFLKVFEIDGVCYSHYFVSGPMGRPVSTARALLTKHHKSCVQGHLQTYEVAMANDATGRRITGIMAGAFYQHQEGYLNPQTNANTFRGIHVLYGVDNGSFSHNAVDLVYLKDRFGG